jgi:hypothetical protein
VLVAQACADIVPNTYSTISTVTAFVTLITVTLTYVTAIKLHRPALELLVLLAVYAKSTVFDNYFLKTFSVYMLAVGWLFAPVMFNPNGLDSQAAVSDFRQWIKWMLSSAEVGIYPYLLHTPCPYTLRKCYST